VIEAWLTVAWMDLVVRWLPYRMWRPWLRAVPPTGRASAHDPKALADWVAIGASHYPRAVGCLPRALALRAVLARRGLSAHVRIGATRARDTVLAHAWVEHDGQVLNDAQDIGTRYILLEHWAGQD
jgi:hypothetical protein